jgi:protein ImuB
MKGGRGAGGGGSPGRAGVGRRGDKKADAGKEIGRSDLFPSPRGRKRCEHTFVSMSAPPPLITCVLLPRFELNCAAGGRSELLGTPVAIAPEPGSQRIGAVSAAAEAFGIDPGMRLGEALSRCQQLTMIPPDPAGVADAFERMLIALESIGAAVEPLRPGVVCFDARGLLRLHGGAGSGLGNRSGLAGGSGLGGGSGTNRGTSLGLGRMATKQEVEGVLMAARRALAAPARFGVAPTRFAALAAATRARVRHPLIVTGGAREAKAFLASMPVDLLRGDPQLTALVEAFERFGVGTLGELAALPRSAIADRFGPPGLRAHQLASGGDSPLRPRDAGEFVRESLELPDASSGQQLERALGLLIDRLLARRERRGRTLRAVVLSAVLVERGGTWRQQVTFRESLSDPVRMRLALTPRLGLLPAPAQALRLAVERFGPPTNDQRALLDEPAQTRAARLREAIRQVRAVAGPDAALRVLMIDPNSRFPERRSVLTPFER